MNHYMTRHSVVYKRIVQLTRAFYFYPFIPFCFRAGPHAPHQGYKRKHRNVFLNKIFRSILLSETEEK